MSSDSKSNYGHIPTSHEQFVVMQLTPAQARPILKRDQSPDILVMCRGYNDEDDQFTELAWGEEADS